jgi:hypothetical protein
MHKLIAIAVTVASLSGCQTTTQMQNASSGGWENATSCSQIYAAFKAYDNDRQSLEILAQAAGVTEPNLQGVTPETVDSYYENLRNSANLALILKGCQPLS